MSSDNRLERRKLGSNNKRRDDQTLPDYQNTTDDSAIYSTIKFGLIAATSYGLYKSGALREITKPLLEVADSMAKNGTDKAGTVLHTIKEWSHLRNLDASQLSKSARQKYAIPKDSIFRERDNNILNTVFKDLRDYDNNRRFTSTSNFVRIRRIMQDTQVDMHLLQKMIKENVQNMEKVRTDYTRTQLYSRLREVREFYNTLSHNQTGEGQATTFMQKAMDELINITTLSDKKAAQQLRESGYRSLTLKDVADFVQENNQTFLRQKEGLDIDLNSKSNEKYVGLMDYINKTLNDPAYNTSNGNVFDTRQWENMVIDDNIRISESGKIIDFRMTSENIVGFKRTLANEFKLPVVQFNPLKTLLGWDKAGRYKPFLGAISPNQFDPNITKMAGNVRIGDWMAEQFGEEFRNKPISIINGVAYTTEKGTNGKESVLKELGSGLKLHNISYADKSAGLKPLVNAGRQMAGLHLDQTEVRGGQFKKDVFNFLDIGNTEIHPNANYRGTPGFDETTSIDELFNKGIDWVAGKIIGFDAADEAIVREMSTRNFKNLFGEGFNDFEIAGSKINPKMFTTSREGFKFSKGVKELTQGNLEGATDEFIGFFAQFGSGQRADGTMGDFFTERTGVGWTVFNQLSEGLGKLGLGVDSKKTPWGLAGNLILKRALPVYLALQVPELINYFTEPFFGKDEDGNRDNITKVFMRNIVKPIDLAAHEAMDFIGATNVFKFLGEMTPGSDQINELPGIYQLGLGQTKEEREEYIDNGYDPIRKGRYWGSGNTPFTGGKIMYWRPNIYRRIEANVDFSDSKWGSRQEYYNNTWFPNPVNPLAPINHFILDRNHYDKKHYQDRPYLQTAPEGQNIPIIGPLFGATIGRIINPPTKMHTEYWQQGLQVNPEDERKSSLLTDGTLYGTAQFAPNLYDNRQNSDIHVYNQVQQQVADANREYQNNLALSAYEAKQLVSKGYQDNAGITFETRSILPERTYDRYNTPFEVYTTPSGQMNIVDVPDEMNLYDVNRDLQNWSINKVLGTNQRINPRNITEINNWVNPDVPVGNDSQEIDNAFMYGLGEQYNWLGEIAGLKGFALQQFVTGNPNEKARVIENSGYAYSSNNDFWEENLGGFGGNLSEIVRRFIPKRNNNVEYVNPIRNTMPSWMPGSNYFTDFKHGDPYSKIDNGEERLPGEGFERLNNMEGLMEFNIDGSHIGQSKEEIVKQMLGQNQYKNASDTERDKINKKNRNRVVQSWVDSKLAFSTGGTVQDKRNGILSTYDALVHDPTSRTRMSLVNIKTVDAETLKNLRRHQEPIHEDRRKVNYDLWATGNKQSKGYMYYVDEKDPTNNYTIGFRFDKKLLKDTLKNVHDARREVQTAVDKGIIGRGELYSPIERFKILADVAPYSQEFKDVSAQLTPDKLTASQEREVSAIRDRLQQQKEPLRVYDYKFKTANLQTELVTVDKIIDNNTIITKEYGKEHAIKFAGINVSEAYKQPYDKRRSKGEAAEDILRKHMRRGQKIAISYDADERNKYSKDSTDSIRAVVTARGRNLNQVLLNEGLANEKKDDGSAAAVNARYTKGEIAFGSAMETLTHEVAGNIPFIGSKFLQVRSPYEQYRKREVYSKDFQSWNHPIRDILVPAVQEQMANNTLGGFGGIIAGAFIGSMFGNGPFGKIIGTTIGATLPALGKAVFLAGSDKDRDWRPKRRRDQEELNEYVDILKYVKNTKLYEQYKTKALKEDNFDVDKFMESEKYEGVQNQLRQRELEDYKKKVKLDFKHRGNYNFKYGEPKYETEKKMNRKDVISAINREISEIQNERKVTKLPKNALAAIEYKQAAEQTMYGYDPGESLVNIMTALPKKERQYFKHFMDAPEEEKDKILRIAPSYLRRALQASWGMKVDEKPDLTEYFQKHGLPGADWVGWDENTDMDDVKVKLVHQNNLDPGEFDIWDNTQERADETNIPIPDIDATNSARNVQIRLMQILGQRGFNDVQVDFMNGIGNSNQTTINTRHDARNDVAQQIAAMNI